MKKIVMLFVFVCMVFLQAQVGLAADKVWSDDDFRLSSIHRLYLNEYEMNYSPSGTSPKISEIADMFYQNGMAAKYFVLPDADFSRFLLRDGKIDLTALQGADLKKTVREHVADYADAYVVMTIVHNNRVVIFYDVYAAQTGKMVFSYQVVAGSGDDDNLRTYEGLTKRFYQALEKETKVQAKKKK